MISFRCSSMGLVTYCEILDNKTTAYFKTTTYLEPEDVATLNAICTEYAYVLRKVPGSVSAALFAALIDGACDMTDPNNKDACQFLEGLEHV